MKVLHLLSNWKWTERAEPAADLAAAQQKLGVEVAFVCGAQPGTSDENGVEFQVRHKGLEAIAIDFPKHFRPGAFARDIAAIRRLLLERRFDVVHTHMPNDHLAAAFARAGLSPRPPIVRSCYEPDGPEPGLRSRLLHTRATDGVVVLSERARSALKPWLRSARPCVAVIEPAIDLDRFRPAADRTAARAGFGLAPDARVIGMVTRIRQARRVDVGIGAMRLLATRIPGIRMLLIGRGSEEAVESEVHRPIRAHGLEQVVLLPGYCRGERLVSAYAAMDLLLYPTPGTDKSCRTVREALACGVPVVAPPIGYLPELIRDGISGCLLPTLSAECAAGTIYRVITDPAILSDMKRAAGDEARKRFSLDRQARETIALYEDILASNAGR